MATLNIYDMRQFIRENAEQYHKDVLDFLNRAAATGAMDSKTYWDLVKQLLLDLVEQAKYDE